MAVPKQIQLTIGIRMKFALSYDDINVFVENKEKHVKDPMENNLL